MPDTAPLAERLSSLAPAVDPIAARRLFEQRRHHSGRPRWLLATAAAALVGVGVAGLWAVDRPAEPRSAEPGSAEPGGVEPGNTESGTDDPDPGTPDTGTPAPSGPLTEGNGYETVIVAETTRAYGRARLATTPADFAAAWDDLGTGGDAPEIDLERAAALVMTRPDNACADTLVRFDLDTAAAAPVWIPVFEDRSDDCEDPLLSWIYVVAIDRAALDPEAVIRLPADPLFEVAEVALTYRATTPPPVDEPIAGIDQLTATGVRVPVPALGEPVLVSMMSHGLVWVVTHDDGSASVLPATVDPPADDDAGVAGLAQLVWVSVDGDGFAAGGFTWDAHGRSINGGRANDLVGFAATVEGGEIEIFLSDATRAPGAPDTGISPIDRDRTMAALADVFGEPIDTMTSRALSSSGPIWRYLDAALVVQRGVGMICDVADDVPVTSLTTCGDDETALATTVTSTSPDITSWFFAPILAWQDPVDGFTRVVALGGSAGRNDARPDEVEVAVTEMTVSCAPGVGLRVGFRIEATGPASFELVVVDGGVELAQVAGQMTEAGWMEVGSELRAPPSRDAVVWLSYGAADVELPFAVDEVPDCDP